MYSNSLKYTERGGDIQITVQFKPGESKDRICIQVEDNGYGIKEEDQAKLFKIFSSIRDPQRGVNTEGMGLGLVICKMIVEQFGGKIDFTSEFKRGSNFYYDFELEDFQIEEMPRSDKSQTDLSSESELPPIA